MSKVSLNVKELLEWLDNDPSREELLIQEVPISRSLLNQIKRNYVPMERTIKAIVETMGRFPKGAKVAG